MDDVDHAADNSEQADPPERIDLARVVLAQARRNAQSSAYRKPSHSARRRRARRPLTTEQPKESA
jgi:hypothetical protein